MDPQSFLDSLCRRHGLAPQQAEPLLPLVQLAWTARPTVRRRILEWVEETLARRPVWDGPPSQRTSEAGADEQALLSVVARMLHRWRSDPAA